MESNPLVQCMIDMISLDQDHASLVPERLHMALRGIELYDGQCDMLLGVKGLPHTSAELVTLGVFYTEGNQLFLHRGIHKALQDKSQRKDKLLSRLRLLAEKHGYREDSDEL